MPKRKTRARKPTRGTIAFQGEAGAYSDLACRIAYPQLKTLPCDSFEDAFAAVLSGKARYAMIPVENSVAGRVAEIHQLLPNTGLHIVAERFQRVTHHLLALRGASLRQIKTVHSHVHALSQCRNFIRRHKLTPIVHADTAGAAAEVAGRGNRSAAAIASALAGKIYGLKSLKSGIEDAQHNTTRFLILARAPANPDPAKGRVMTSFVFRVRNVPAAIYKALGGFATNGVNMSKLESYMIGGNFTSAQFYADVEGHPVEKNLKLAFEELEFFSREVKILGVYHADPFRYRGRKKRGK
jgi:prephenate dehydratase